MGGTIESGSQAPVALSAGHRRADPYRLPRVLQGGLLLLVAAECVLVVYSDLGRLRKADLLHILIALVGLRLRWLAPKADAESRGTSVGWYGVAFSAILLAALALVDFATR